MEFSKTGYESLLSWVAPQSHSQSLWIKNYIYKKKQGSWLSTLTPRAHDSAELKRSLHAGLLDANSRQEIRAMRGAWRQQEHRERNGKPINFQLPENISKELTQISKEWGVSRTHVLGQLISDATRKIEADRTKANKKVIQLKERLVKNTKEKLESDSVRNNVINKATELLVQEVIFNCRLIEAIGEVKDGDLVELKEESVQVRLKDRMKEIDDKLPYIKSLRGTIKPIHEHLTADGS